MLSRSRTRLSMKANSLASTVYSRDQRCRARSESHDEQASTNGARSPRISLSRQTEGERPRRPSNRLTTAS
eukprot:3410018-Amphidinium_carterae.1